MGSLYPTDIVVGQRIEKKMHNVLLFINGRRSKKEREKKISARYTLLYIYLLFIVVIGAAALIGSSI
jgi:hypothetical protein